MWFGFGLVLVGVLLLLNNLGIIQGNTWSYIWPSIVILLGLAILLRRKERDSLQPKVRVEKDDHKHKNEEKKEA